MSETPAWFTVGLCSIGLRIHQAVDDATQAAYWVDFEGETSPEEWAEFCRVVVRRFRWRFLPSTPELLDALREFRGGPSNGELQAEAVTAYERVLDASTYSLEAGAMWSYRTVAEKCGKAAADALVAAGGHNAFATTWDEAKRRERFIAAYTERAKESPALRLAAPKEQEQITTGDHVVPPTQAVEIIRKLTGMVDKPRVEPRPRLTPEQWEAERKRKLEAFKVLEQGEEIER